MPAIPARGGEFLLWGIFSGAFACVVLTQGGWQWWGWVQALGPAPPGGLCPQPLPSVSSLRGEVRGSLGDFSGLPGSPAGKGREGFTWRPPG